MCIYVMSNNKYTGFYHSDRPLTQQALARSLSYALVPQLPRSRGFLLRFLRAFWITIGREFHALDRLRLDKYLFLIRCYVAAGFEVFVKQKVLAKRGKDANADDNDRKKRKREWNSLGHATNVNTRNSNNRTNNNKKSKLQKRDSDAQKYDNEHDDNQGKHTGGEINQNHHVIDEGDGSSNDNWTDLESYISMLEEGPLSPLNFKPNSNIKSSNKSGSYSRPPSQTNGNTIPMPLGPDGLRYHIMDVWFDELGKVLELDSTEFTEDFNATGKPTSHNPDVPIDLLLRPFVILRKESPMKTVRQRAEQVIDDQRLVMWGFREAKKVDDDDESVEDDEEWGGFDD